MSVAITPSSSLGFARPLTAHVKRTLTITNNNALPVGFKVKTTAPKLYCVRPNSGRVEPGESVEVQVMLQAMREEPPLNIKCKDKFLIQSTLITPEKETMPLQDIWNTESIEDIHSQKIRVVYLPPEGQAVPEEDEGQGHMSGVFNPPLFTTTREGNGHAAAPIPDFGVVDEHAAGQPHILVDAPSTPPADLVAPPEQVHHEDSQSQDESAFVNVNVHPPPAQRTPPAPPAPALDPNPELVSKLNEAHAEIERLRNLISSMPEPSTVAPTAITSSPSEFRRRTTRAYSDDGSTLGAETEAGTYMEDMVVQPEGVPLQVVIIIALGVFLTTYLFF